MAPHRVPHASLNADEAIRGAPVACSLQTEDAAKGMRPTLGPAAGVLLNLLAITGTQHVEARVTASQLWKARALEAGGNLKTLTTMLQALDGEAHAARVNDLKCEAMLEAAFARHADQPSVVHKVLDSGMHVFKIVLSGGEQGTFDLSYFYDPEGSKPIAVQVLSLPASWRLTHPGGHGRDQSAILLSIHDRLDETRCLLGFRTSDPFLAFVVRSAGGRIAMLRPRRASGA